MAAGLAQRSSPAPWPRPADTGCASSGVSNLAHLDVVEHLGAATPRRAISGQWQAVWPPPICRARPWDPLGFAARCTRPG